MDYEMRQTIAIMKKMVADGKITQVDAEKYCPELAESEDEKAINAIKKLVYWADGNQQVTSEQYNLIMTWLEKQKRAEREKEGNSLCKGEQKPAKNKGMNLKEEEMTPFQERVFCIIDTTIEEEQGLKQVCDELLSLAHDEIMQKSAWSKEDDTRFQNCVAIVSTNQLYKDEEKEPIYDWLKSLRPHKH